MLLEQESRAPVNTVCEGRHNNLRRLDMRLDGSEWLPALLLLWVVPAFLVAYFASKKQRSFVGFLVISLIIGWLIPAIVVLVMKRDAPALTRSCPYCAELVQNEATLCKHCGKELPVNEALKKAKPSRWD